MAIAEATAETPGKQINFEPIRANLTARMRSLQTLTTTGRSTDKNGVFIEPSRAYLDNTLSLSIYQFTTGGTILTTQDNFLKRGINLDDLGNPLRSQYQRFKEDLSYVSVLESIRLTGINERIQFLINGKRDTSDDQIKDESIQYFNDIFGRAIHLYPHVALGIEVELPLEKRLTDFNLTFPDYIAGRERFKTLSQIWKATRGQHLEKLTLPLPIWQKDEFSDNDERTNQASIYFTQLFDAKKRTWTPGLTVQIGTDDQENPFRSSFSINEVEAVRLVGQPEDKTTFKFTPELVPGNPGWDLVPRPNWIRHYLDFRGFGQASYRLDNHFMVDKAELYSQSLLVPEDNSELIKMRKAKLWELNGDSIEQGFIALDLGCERIMMYEVQGAFPWNMSIRENAPYLLDHILRGHSSHETGGDVTRYAGEDIVTRLASIPRGD